MKYIVINGIETINTVNDIEPFQFITAHSTQKNRLYQCQSKNLYTIILGHSFMTYPRSGWFYDIPGSKCYTYNLQNTVTYIKEFTVNFIKYINRQKITKEVHLVWKFKILM